MALDLTGLNSYTDESSEMIRKGVLAGNTPNIIGLLPGVKETKQIRTMASDVIVQLGHCSFNASGTTVLGNTLMTTVECNVAENICPADLNGFYEQTQLKPGSYNQEIPFEELYLTEKMEKLSKAIDLMIWQGNTSTGSGNLGKVNGILQRLDVEYSASTIAGPVSALTISNAISIVQNTVLLLPQDAVGIEGNTLFCSYAEFQIWSLAMVNANLIHFPVNFNPTDGVIIPGTMVRIRPVTGLVGTTRRVLTNAENLVYGFDVLSEQDVAELWFSKDDRTVKYLALWKMGTQVVFPSLAVVS